MKSEMTRYLLLTFGFGVLFGAVAIGLGALLEPGPIAGLVMGSASVLLGTEVGSRIGLRLWKDER